MKRFTYYMPTKVLFGDGCVEKVADAVGEVGGGKVLVVTGKSSMKKTGILDRVLDNISGFDVEVFAQIETDPSVDIVDEGAQNAVGKDVIVALGGGSALDAAKAISVASANSENAIDYLRGETVKNPGPKIVALPTTSGTGSEVTEVSVLSDPKNNIKKSFRSPHMYPATSLDDPQLTYTMPQEVTVSSGFDALTHAVEAYTSKRSQPICDVLCRQATKLAVENLVKTVENPNDAYPRSNMMLASLMAGYGITHSGAGLVHGLSYSLYKTTGVAHGMACAILLPHVMRYNRGYEEGKYTQLADDIGVETVDELIHTIQEIGEKVGVPQHLCEIGVKEDDVSQLVESAMGGSTRVNPRPVKEDDLSGFLKNTI